MIARLGQTLSWDAENRLVQVVSGTITTTMGYDGDGKRVTLADPNGVTLFVSPLYEVFVPVSATVPTITSTVYPTQTYTARLPVVTGSWDGVDGALSEVTRYYFADGKRIAMRAGNGGVPTYLYQDHLGSASLAVDTATGSQRYMPYGATRSGGVPTDFQFTGQRNDTATGLYYYGARYHDPFTGRFVSPDTIVPSPGNPQALNRYTYALSNPLRYRDPTGHWIETAWDLANVAWDIHELQQDPSFLNVGALVLDVAAVVAPAVPGGVGLLVRGEKAAAVAADVMTHADDMAGLAKAINRGSDSARRLDRFMEAGHGCDPHDPEVIRGRSAHARRTPSIVR